MAIRNPAASDWVLLPPGEQQLDTGWVGYRHVSGMLHWHHAAADEDRLSAALVLPTPVEDDSGITHALEHMVLRGSARFPDPATFLELRSQLALLEFNATTQKESTRFHLTGYDPASALRGIDFMVDAVFQPLLQDEDYMQEVVDKNTESGALYRELLFYLRHKPFRDATDMAINQHPRAPLYGGMPETVIKLELKALRRYHQQHYRPEKTLLLTSGSWPMVALWRQLSKTLKHVASAPLPTPPLSSLWQKPSAEQQKIETLPISSKWANVLHPTLSTPRHQAFLKQLGVKLMELKSDFSPAPALHFRVSPSTDLQSLQRYVEDVARNMPSRRVAWQSDYQARRAGQEMVRRWGDGLHRLYHGFAITPFSPCYLAADTSDPLLCDRHAAPVKGEWMAASPALTRMAILCRLSVRDSQTQKVIKRWLNLCQQRTLRWAWMRGKPILGAMGEWHYGNVLVVGYTADVPLDEADALRQFWHNSLSADEISAVDAEWQHTANGISLLVAGSVPVFRTGSILVSHRDDHDAMHVTIAFPHTVESGDIAAFGQAVMGTRMMQSRRLSGRCYSLSVSIDLLSYELVFASVADSDPSVTFIALLHAVESLCRPLDKETVEHRCQGGLGLVSGRYYKSNARFHRALLAMLNQTLAVDFSSVSADSLSELARKVLSAFKHPTMH